MLTLERSAATTRRDEQNLSRALNGTLGARRFVEAEWKMEVFAKKPCFEVLDESAGQYAAMVGNT
jgi:hypothetical protein